MDLKNNSTVNFFTKYKNCTFCNSKNLKKKTNIKINENFYTKAIISDLSLKKNKINELDIYECQKCYLIQISPWFTKKISRKIYSNIYGQHNKNWSNYLSFINYGKTPNHGSLFKLLIKNIKIRNYAEFNSPFMGLFFNIFLKEYIKNKIFYKKLSKNLINYLSSRQFAGKSKKFIKDTEVKIKKIIKEINLDKKKNFLGKKINKYLLVDDSDMCWGQNDNYKSVNSRSLASEFFDLEIIDINKKNKINLDLFGIFLTLDHTFEPKKILDGALNLSRYVIVQCHITNEVTRQHQFSFTSKFLNYLKSIDVSCINLTEKINKNPSSNELYFLCSKNKNLINKIKI